MRLEFKEFRDGVRGVSSWREVYLIYVLGGLDPCARWANQIQFEVPEVCGRFG